MAISTASFHAGGQSAGYNIVVQDQLRPNRWTTPVICSQFHDSVISTMHFLMRARALAVFPGGYETLDEYFEALTLIQTSKFKRVLILLFGLEC